MIGAENEISSVTRAGRVVYAARVLARFGIGDTKSGKRVCYCLCAGLRSNLFGYKVEGIELIILKKPAVYYSMGLSRFSDRYAANDALTIDQDVNHLLKIDF